MDTFQISGARYNDTFICRLDGDEIVKQEVTGEPQVIGMRITAYKELESTTKQYYDRLVELGEIVPPKSQEELIKETQDALAVSQQTNREMLDLIQEMKNELKGLKEDGYKSNDSSSPKANTQRKSKPNSAASAKANTGQESDACEL